MHGRGVFVPHWVPARSFELPDGLEPVSVAGRCQGLLGYVVYEEPSALRYHELIWMPSLVRFRGKQRTHRGYFVAVMYVDDETTLRAGREIWGLPKTLARFQEGPRGVTVEAEDGSRVELRYRMAPVAAKVGGRLATLQHAAGGATLFRAKMRSRATGCIAKVTHFQQGSGAAAAGWAGFEGSRALPLGVGIRRFESHMAAPVALER